MSPYVDNKVLAQLVSFREDPEMVKLKETVASALQQAKRRVATSTHFNGKQALDIMLPLCELAFGYSIGAQTDLANHLDAVAAAALSREEAEAEPEVVIGLDYEDANAITSELTELAASLTAIILAPKTDEERQQLVQTAVARLTRVSEAIEGLIVNDPDDEEDEEEDEDEFDIEDDEDEESDDDDDDNGEGARADEDDDESEEPAPKIAIAAAAAAAPTVRN